MFLGRAAMANCGKKNLNLCSALALPSWLRFISMLRAKLNPVESSTEPSSLLAFSGASTISAKPLCTKLHSHFFQIDQRNVWKSDHKLVLQKFPSRLHHSEHEWIFGIQLQNVNMKAAYRETKLCRSKSTALVPKRKLRRCIRYYFVGNEYPKT